MKRMMTLLCGLVVAAIVAVPAFATGTPQPGQVSNADGRNGGVSAPGPHCHYNLVASANQQSSFDSIITGAIHQAHTQTGLPTGIFQATGCP